MSIEEDDASLKDLVSKTLQNNGVLGKIQAQLRASVFLALEDEFQDKNIPLLSASTKQLLATSEGALAAALVHNFLQCLNMDFSLSVFAPESGLSSLWNFPGEDALTRDLNLNCGKGNGKAPLLIELLRERTSTSTLDTETQLKKDKGSLSQLRPHDRGPLPQLSSTRTFQPLSDLSSTSNIVRNNSIPLKQQDTGISNFPLNKEKSGFNEKDLSQRSNSFPKKEDRYLHQASEENKNKGGLGHLTQRSDAIDGSTSDTADEISFGNTKSQEKSNGSNDEENKLTKTSLTGLEKQYEDDFSSMSEKEGQDDDDDDNSAEDDEEEEDIEEAEDIDEDISIDDLINSSASLNSDHTKDLTLSQASDVPNYQEEM